MVQFRRKIKENLFSVICQLRLDNAFLKMTSNKARILTYHGVAKRSPEVFNWQQITGEAFFHQMTYLKENFRVIPLLVLLEEVFLRHKIPNQCVAITFDDGYENNFSVVYPILKSLNLPVTFFISTSFIGKNKCSLWFDSIYDALSKYSGMSVDLSSIGFGKLDTSTPLAKSNSILYLTESLKFMSYTNRQEKMAKIIAQIGIKRNERSTFPGMTWDQLSILANDRLVTIGGHGHTHSVLTHLSKEDAWQEITINKRLLEARLDKKVAIFSYPNGNFSIKLVSLLKRAGYTFAVTTKEAFVGSNPYLVQRITVRNPSTMHNYRALVSGIVPVYNKIWHN